MIAPLAHTLTAAPFAFENHQILHTRSTDMFGMKHLTISLLAGLVIGAHGQDFISGLELSAQDIETLCASSAASLPEVDSFCEFALE